MKKLLAILLLFIYFSSTAGLAINYHYCGGQLARVSILNFENLKGCACNPKGFPKDCCNDELKFQKSDEHKTVQKAQITGSGSIAFTISPSVNNVFFHPEGIDIECKIINVRRSKPLPVFLLFRVLRV